MEHQISYSDTGANADMIPIRQAEILEKEGIITIEWENKRRTVQVAAEDEGHLEIVGKTQGRGMLNEVVIVAGLRSPLIGGRGFIDRGMELKYTDEGVYLKFKVNSNNETREDKIGEYDCNRGIWTMDIKEMLMRPDPRGKQIPQRSLIKNDKDTVVNSSRVENKSRVSRRDYALCYELHEALLHVVPFRTMANCIESGAWKNVHKRITPNLLRRIADREDCPICSLTWNTPKLQGSGMTIENIGEEFAFDSEGKFKETSLGCNYSCTVMDLGSGYSRYYGLKQKTAVIDAIKEWCIEMLSYGKIPKRGRCDAGSVETGQEFRKAMAVLGLEVKPNVPKDPQDAVEKKWQTLHNGIAKVIASVDSLDKNDWLLSGTTANNIRNIITNSRSKRYSNTKTPLELITGRPADLTLIQTLKVGDVVVVAHKKDKSITKPRNVMARVMDVNLDGRAEALLKYMDESQKLQKRKGMIPVRDTVTGPIASRTRSREVKMCENNDGVIVIDIEG